LYTGIDEIPESLLPETEKRPKINLIKQSHENGFMPPLGWCSFKIQKEK
jgi:hypothetical protein